MFLYNFYEDYLVTRSTCKNLTRETFLFRGLERDRDIGGQRFRERERERDWGLGVSRKRERDWGLGV